MNFRNYRNFMAVTFILGCLLAPAKLFALSADPWPEVTQPIQNGSFFQGLAQADHFLHEHPDDVLLLRLKGICLIALNRNPEAIGTLKQALKNDPANVASRFYLAQAEATYGDVVTAISDLEQVISEAPQSEYAAQAKEVLPDLQNLSKNCQAVTNSKRWHIFLRAGGEYDDNVALLPTSGQHHIGAFRFVSSADVDYTLLDQKLDESPVTLGLQYDFYQSLHDNTAARLYDYQSQNISLFLRKDWALCDIPLQTEFSGGYTYDNLGNKDYSDTFHLKVIQGIQWADWARLSLDFSTNWIDYSAQPAVPSSMNSRDGETYTAGVTQYFSLFQKRWTLGVGYDYTNFATSGSLYNEDLHKALVTSNLVLPADFTFTSSYTYMSSYYDTYTPQPLRDDSTHTIAFGLSHPLFVKDLLADVNYYRTMVSSSQGFARYNQNIISLGLRYSF